LITARPSLQADRPPGDPKRRGSKSGRARQAPRFLVVFAVGVGLVFGFPGLFVLYRSVRLGAQLSSTFEEVRGPLWRTVLLAVSVSVSAAVIGTFLAFLLARTQLPGKRLLRVLLILPLVFPSFVGAAAFVTSWAPGGLTYEVLTAVGINPPRRFRGFVPAWMVLTLFTYPYVLLPVLARFRTLRISLEESARLLGNSSFAAFRRVTLPQLRPVVAAGSLLVFLYVISDYGAVQILGYDTLTRVVFSTLLSDQAVSFSAAFTVLALAWLVASQERKASARVGADDKAEPSIYRRPVQLGRAKVPALMVAWSVVIAAFVTPVATLLIWSGRGLSAGRVDLSELVGPTLTTVLAGVITGVLAILIVLPVAVLGVRFSTGVGRVAGTLVVAGFALPGVVIALAFVFWALNFPGASLLYQTLPLLIVAYVVHFGAQALGAGEGAVRAVPDRLREASRLLDASPLERLTRVELPLMRPGLTAGAGLVLLSTVKELPATLLLAPTGFETLATEIWGSFGEGFYAAAATSSLVLILVSGVLTWWLVLREPEEAPAGPPEVSVVQ